MTARGLIGFLFILYCVEVGTLMVVVPWSPYWERLALDLPQVELQLAALRPWVRGAVSGFGLIHLVWGAHDLDAWLLSRRRPGEQARSRNQPDGARGDSSTSHLPLP